MRYIATTFAHGNGPYSRTVDWAIEINNVRTEKGLPRLPIVIPLVYPKRQERILMEEIEANSPGFLVNHPDEILFDRYQGELLSSIMFKGSDYSANLALLVDRYYDVESRIMEHLDGKRKVWSFDGRDFELDLRDAELQLGLNNRIQTRLPNQFYSAGGAGPFDEILERAIADEEVRLDKEIMKKVLPITRRMIENQKLIISNEPGVFSYDSERNKRSNEIYSPPFIHPPQRDTTKLPGKGVYLIMTGIDGIRESGIYGAAAELGIRLYAPEFMAKSLPEDIRNKITFLPPSRINNPNIIAQYGRGGWSTVWLSHLAEKGFITPKYNKNDDPEILFNQRGIERLGLGAIIDNNPMAALKKAISLAEEVSKFNSGLKNRFGTLDGIRFSAEIVAKSMGY